MHQLALAPRCALLLYDDANTEVVDRRRGNAEISY
jgi:hypothetical protein